jgi:Protein of unknown function (DUF3768)
MDQIATSENVRRIREFNDAFRTTFTGGLVVVTSGVDGLPADIKARVLHRVRTFREFTDDNDPHREHDFCAFFVAGNRYFGKIDYYDRDMRFGSEDPADPEKTTRVLTIMRADEY